MHSAPAPRPGAGSCTARCEPKYRVEQGNEAAKIVEVAVAIGADLIVLGARGAEGIPGTATHVGRSVAHNVVVDAQCPVLTFRA